MSLMKNVLYLDKDVTLYNTVSGFSDLNRLTILLLIVSSRVNYLVLVKQTWSGAFNIIYVDKHCKPNVETASR